MATIRVGVREFRERIASFLESDTPVAVTRRGDTVGVYVPIPLKRTISADLSELKAAADRLAVALKDVDEEELVTEFRQMRRRGKDGEALRDDCSRCEHCDSRRFRPARQILETYSARGVRFFVPDIGFKDAQKYLPGVLKKYGTPNVDVEAALDYLRRLVEPVGPERYSLFESEVCERLRGRDEDDWPVVACAIALACGIWTEDADFFGTGVAIWKTNRIEIFLKAAAK